MENKKLTLAIKSISDNFNLAASEGYVSLMNKALNLTDAQIGKAANHFLRLETLSKMPSLMQWKKAAGVCEGNPIEIACQRFLGKVHEYLTSDFISSSEKKEFDQSLSEVELRTLNSLGGISGLWADTHQEGYRRSISRILYELKQEFLNSATEANILAKPHANNGIEFKKADVEELVQNSVKRLS